jgi:hypothetical protein
MSWLYSQALVEEYLGENSLDGAQSAPLSGSRTQQAYCALDKMTGFSRLSQFGMTYKPLMENLGVELLTLYLADFHAKTSAPQGKAQELTVNGLECGEKWHGLLARFDPDSHLWRTVQCSLVEDLNESFQTLPQWGMTVGGELYLRPTLVQTTNENESGLWLTPSTVDIPTRSAESMEKRFDYRKKIGRKGVGAGCLSEQVEWSGTGPPIGYITKESWPTPTANMYKGSSAAVIRKNGQDRSWQSLHYAVEQVTDIGGRLNPTWVEWLMGWPLGWTDLKPLEMDKFHCALQPLGESSQEEHN